MPTSKRAKVKDALGYSFTAHCVWSAPETNPDKSIECKFWGYGRVEGGPAGVITDRFSLHASGPGTVVAWHDPVTDETKTKKTIMDVQPIGQDRTVVNFGISVSNFEIVDDVAILTLLIEISCNQYDSTTALPTWSEHDSIEYDIKVRKW